MKSLWGKKVKGDSEVLIPLAICISLIVGILVKDWIIENISASILISLFCLGVIAVVELCIINYKKLKKEEGAEGTEEKSEEEN